MGYLALNSGFKPWFLICPCHSLATILTTLANLNISLSAKMLMKMHHYNNLEAEKVVCECILVFMTQSKLTDKHTELWWPASCNGTACAHDMLGTSRIYWVWLGCGYKVGFNLLGDYFSCHLTEEVHDDTSNILPPVSMCLSSNTRMICRHSYSIVK
jgi:hypothetical protein